MAWPGTCGDPEEGRRGASPVGSPPPAPSRVLVPPGAGEGWSGLSLGPLPAEAALPWPGLGVGGRGCFSKVLSSSPLRIGGGSKGRGHPPERLPEGLQTCGPQVSPGPVVVPTAQRLQHLCPDPPQAPAPAHLSCTEASHTLFHQQSFVSAIERPPWGPGAPRVRATGAGRSWGGLCPGGPRGPGPGQECTVGSGPLLGPMGPWPPLHAASGEGPSSGGSRAGNGRHYQTVLDRRTRSNRAW